MPAKSPEALARKKERAKQRKREKRTPAAKPSGEYVRKWFVGPPMAPMSKSALRAMLAQAARNTALLDTPD